MSLYDTRPSLQNSFKLTARHDVIESILKIRDFSMKNADNVSLPLQLYHASIYSDLTNLSPEKGQGFGVWMQGNLKEAAHFAVSRSYDILTGHRYADTTPTIYELGVSFKNLAIFPNESSLYSFSVDGGNKPYDLSFHDVRQLLLENGFDGIYLLAEKTVSSISADNIHIKSEVDATPLYKELVLPDLFKRFGRDPFSVAPT